VKLLQFHNLIAGELLRYFVSSVKYCYRIRHSISDVVSVRVV